MREPWPTTRAPFVGRQRELRALLQHLELAGQGQGDLVLVGGEPGIGKTRLVREFAEHARGRGWQILVGSAFESEGMPPYLPFADALRSYVSACPPRELQARFAEGTPEVALLVPELGGQLPEQHLNLAVHTPHERHRLFESVTGLLLRIARATPGGLLLILDDLHWADKPSLLLLQHLARQLPTSNLMTVGTYRTVAVDRAHPLVEVLAGLSREHLSTRIRLEPVSLEEAASLIDGLLGQTAAPALAEALFRETEGNPFFLEEVVRHLQSEGHDLVDPRTAKSRRDIPEGVKQVIGWRLSRLSAEANRLLQTAAVAGDAVAFEVLEAVSGLHPDALLDALDEVLNSGMLREQGDRYRFSHALIRETLYRNLNTPRRLRLHQQLGDTLERMHAADPEPYLTELAHHFVEGARGIDLERAIVYARRAGDLALRMLAYEEGVRLYQRALRALDQRGEPDGAQRCSLLLALGESQRRAGELRPALETFQQAAAVARALEAPEPLARAAVGYEEAFLATGATRAGPRDPSIVLQEEALRALGEGASDLRVRLLAGLARVYSFVGEWERARRLSEEGVALARRATDPAALAYALNSKRIVISGPWNVEERLAVATELIQVAEVAGERELVLQGRLWRLRALLELGDIASVDRETEGYLALAEALREPEYRAAAAVWVALRAMLDGRFDASEQAARHALAIGQQMASEDAERIFAVQMMVQYREQGRLRELEALPPVVERTSTKYALIPAWGPQLALVDIVLGRPAEAQRTLDLHAADDFGAFPPDWLWLTSIVMTVELCVSLRDHRRAGRLYSLLLPYAAQNVVDAVPRGAVAWHLGNLASLEGWWEEAQRHFEAALELHRRLESRPLLAHSRRDYAAMLLARGARNDRARARDLLERALATYRQLGMERHAARAEELLAERQLGSTPQPEPTFPAGLTRREVDVLRLIASGKTNREIGEELVLSVRTVERHITNLYGKIEARGKADATAFALRHGLIESAAS